MHYRRYDSDKELGIAPLGALGEKYGSPMGVIHRGDLQRILLKAARKNGCTILTSRKVIAVDPNFGSRVQATCTESGDNVWFQGDLVVAADGIKSLLRRQMVLAGGQREPIVDTPHAAYRLLIPRERVQHDPALLAMMDDNMALRYMGPGGHIVAYPLQGNTVYNMVLIHPAPPGSDVGSGSWTSTGSRAEMMAFYGGWAPAVRAWLAHADAAVLEWRLRTQGPLARRVHGGVALAGDAAQPMLPYVAQGAASGIEDAGVLAAALTQTADVPRALAVYQAVRQPRAERISASAAATGRALHLTDGPAQAARDAAIAGRRDGRAAPSTDKWCDSAWQDYMWGTDVMRHTIEAWDQLVAEVEEGQRVALSSL